MNDKAQSKVSRREFLRTSGVAGSAVLLSLGTSKGSSLLGKGEADPRSAGLVDDANFESLYQMYITPSTTAELYVPAGFSTGIMPAEVITRGIGESFAKECEICDEEYSQEDANEKLALPNLVNSVPVGLLPLMTHPFTMVGGINEGYSFDISVIPRPDDNSTLSSSDVLPLADSIAKAPASIPFGQRIGNYYIRVSAEHGYIGGCIKKNVAHVGLLVHYIDPVTGRGTQIFNLHIAGWWQGSTPCIGVYESASGWCHHTCTWNFWSAIYSMVLAASSIYVAYWIAQAIAAATATAAVGILVAIPGVPPPP